MQKKIIALAVAALASGAAFAQTSVVISGNIDLGYSSVDREVDTGSAKIKDTSTGFRGSDASNWSSTEIRLSITEDLGNGLKAGFFNAIGLNPFVGGDGVDEGYGANNYAFGRNRDAYVFLNGKSWGQVAVGYKNTVESQLNGIGNAGSGNLGAIGRAFNSAVAADINDGTGIGLADTSRANVFEYASPVMSGFQFMGQYGYIDKDFEDDVNTVGTREDETTFWSVGGKYANGPLNLGAVYAKEKYEGSGSYGVDKFVAGVYTKAVETSNFYDSDKTTWGLFGNYDFKVAKVFASYANRQLDSTKNGAAGGVQGALTTDADAEYDAFDIGVKVPFAQRFTLSATYGWGDFELKNKLTSAKSQYDVEAYQVALTYDFSKRTSVTGYYANTEWDGSKAANNKSYEADIIGFGLRHQF